MAMSGGTAGDEPALEAITATTSETWTVDTICPHEIRTKRIEIYPGVEMLLDRLDL